MEDKTLGIALVKEACPLCGKTEDGPIIMNSRLSKNRATQVERLHGKVIGYMNKPCSECEGYMAQGFLLIGVIEENTDDPKNPYRSGNVWVIRKEVADKLFPDTSKGAAFIDIKAAKEIGLPFKNI